MPGPPSAAPLPSAPQGAGPSHRRLSGGGLARLGRRIPPWIPAVLLALGALLLWSLSPTTRLEIRVGEGGRLVKTLEVSPGERITYSYVHSVQKTRVDEMLEIAPDGHLVVRETVYDVFGAGLPSDVPDGTFSLDSRTGKFRIADMARELPVLRVRVAFTSQQTLEVPGETMRLDSLAPPTTLLVLGVASRPRIAHLLEWCISSTVLQPSTWVI